MLLFSPIWRQSHDPEGGLCTPFEMKTGMGILGSDCNATRGKSSFAQGRHQKMLLRVTYPPRLAMHGGLVSLSYGLALRRTAADCQQRWASKVASSTLRPRRAGPQVTRSAAAGAGRPGGPLPTAEQRPSRPDPVDSQYCKASNRRVVFVVCISVQNITKIN